ncbi:unnamed protein product [Musa hybrid cultivar]
MTSTILWKCRELQGIRMMPCWLYPNSPAAISINATKRRSLSSFTCTRNRSGWSSSSPTSIGTYPLGIFSSAHSSLPLSRRSSIGDDPLSFLPHPMASVSRALQLDEQSLRMMRCFLQSKL